MDRAREAARLRAAAQARPLQLPNRRRVDDTHRAQTADGLTVWFTIQVSAHARIEEAVFERRGGPADAECAAWVEDLFGPGGATEAPGIPGSDTRRFERFTSDSAVAPLA